MPRAGTGAVDCLVPGWAFCFHGLAIHVLGSSATRILLTVRGLDIRDTSLTRDLSLHGNPVRRTLRSAGTITVVIGTITIVFGANTLHLTLGWHPSGRTLDSDLTVVTTTAGTEDCLGLMLTDVIGVCVHRISPGATTKVVNVTLRRRLLRVNVLRCLVCVVTEAFGLTGCTPVLE